MLLGYVDNDYANLFSSLILSQVIILQTRGYRLHILDYRA